MPSFTADQPGTYRVELIVSNDQGETSEPDVVSITAVVPAVIAQGVGMIDSGEGRITLALPGPPVQAFLTWQRRDGETDNQIRFGNGLETTTLSGMASADPDADSVQCFYADITPYILNSPEAVTYTVTHATPIPGAGMVVIASALEAAIETFDAPNSGEVETISRITLGADRDPRQRLVEIKAGCLFFHRDTSDPVTFDVVPSPHARPAKITLLLGDAQSTDAPRRSEIEFASPAMRH